MVNAYCNVIAAGPAAGPSGAGGGVWVRLRQVDGDFIEWFRARGAVEKEVLATALLAISTGFECNCHLESVAPDSHLERIYVIRAGFGPSG